MEEEEALEDMREAEEEEIERILSQAKQKT